jgi:hypothetical protein
VTNDIVTATLYPTDGDGNTDKSASQAKRQRNEISVKNQKLNLDVQQTGTWGCYFRLNTPIEDWDSGFYHLIQIKYNLPDGNPTNKAVQPVFTISIRDDKICARDEDGKYAPIQSLCSIVGRWVPMSVKITNTTNGLIEYNVNGKVGTMTMSDPHPDLYFKAGQYRVYPNDIKTVTSSSYKDISFVLS